MRRRIMLGAGTALMLGAGFAVFATPPPALAPQPAPQELTIEKAEQDVATLQKQTPVLAERQRRNAEKLLREAASRLEGVKELLPSNNPRLAKYVQNETRVAKNRIEEARKLVEQGGNR